MNDLTDDEFVAAFLAGSISPAAFHHRDHLRLAWCLIRRMGVESASGAISTGIRSFAAHHGQEAKYHETLTQFWVVLVNHLIGAHADITTFERFLDAFAQLLDKELPARHWRRETLQSSAARAQWVAPDLLALPV